MQDVNIDVNEGKFILIYGPTGVGKSTSCLATLTEPILCITTEPRNPKASLDAIGREIKVAFVSPDSYDDLSGFLAKEAAKTEYGYKSLLFDSMSYWMNVSLSQEVEDETYDAEVFKRQRKLTDMTRKDQAAFGSIASLMKRTCKLLGKISQKGVVVVVTAMVQETPKWNRELAAAPAFIGQEFPTNAPGYFDAIGYVESRTDAEGNKLFPPLVRFEGDGFLSKWTGRRKMVDGKARPVVGALDFTKILTL